SDQGGDLFGFNTLSAPAAKLQIPIQPKAIHDEMNAVAFDEFGRMTANLGVEVVPATPAVQNVVLYPFVNPITELIDGTNLPTNLNVTPIATQDGTQIWKITHNGVDTHPIHFHLYDVQVINRVTWDNIIIPPDANELGWKDTVRISPLEDTIVALRPVIPTVPFDLPNSIRMQNPMTMSGSTMGFNNTDINGNPTTAVTNKLVNFGAEYMYHCHILSHEEMDMMRPVVVALPPKRPTWNTTPPTTPISFTGTGNNRRIVLNWIDNSINETGFLVQRTTNDIVWTDVETDPSPLDLPNTLGGPRTLTDATSNATTPYRYRVVAQNTVGYGGQFPSMTATSVSATQGVNLPAAPPAAPTILSATLQAGPQVTLTWRDNATNEANFVIERSTDGVNFTRIAIVPPRNNTGNVSFVDTTMAASMTNTYTYQVAAINLAGSAYSGTISVLGPAVPAAPGSFTAANGTNGTGNNRTVNLSWQDLSNNETGFTIQRATNATFTAGLNTANVAANTTSLNQTGLNKNTQYFYRIRANNGSIVSSAWVNATPFPIRTNP
ncbi:hypothetical protein EG829_17330, partial [bacterium]|nr:hypothetical protein [bacterium]